MSPRTQGLNASRSSSLLSLFRLCHRLQCLPLLFFASALLSSPASAATVTPLITRPIDATQVQPLVRHHPAWAVAANRISAVPDDEDFEHMTLVLARSAARQKAFEQLLAGQQNPASPHFHKWLAPTEVGERYGASDADIAAITGWLASQGLHVNSISPSRTLIRFGGSALNIGRAFQTTLGYYKVHGEKRLSVDADPSLPQAVAPAIQAVRGLFEIGEKPLLKNSPQLSPEITVNGSHFLTPGDFNTIYNVPSAYTGAGVTIGIVGWARVSTVDLDNFRTRTGTSFPNPTVVVPTTFGGIDPGAAYTAPPTCTNDCTGGQGEATLDVIRAGSTAPGANLLLVASTSKGSNDGIGADTEYLVGTTPTPAQIITISFGACEAAAGLSGVTYWDNLFQTAAAEGISVFVSSGDSAAAGCDDAFDTPPTTAVANSPNYICSSSYATCVGGTQFSDTANPSAYWDSSNSTGYKSVLGYIPEGGWNESWDGTTPSVTGTGGGVSTIIATPSWQTGTGIPAARAGRYTPDVSFSASGHDGYLACLAASGNSTANAGCTGSTSWRFTIFSGTSASAPSMAGVAALLIQKTGSRQGNLNPALYALASSSASSSVFHDVTVASSGVSSCSLSVPSTCNNSIPGPTGLTGAQAGYLVTTGYDEVTGLGSLDVSNFLANYTNVASTATPTFSLAGSAVQVTRGASNTSTITVTPMNGFTGTVTLKAAVTSSPSGAVYAPTLSFGTGTSVTLSGSTAQTATLTIGTTAATTAAATPQPRPGSYAYSAGGAFLAGLILLSIPARSRAWKKVLGMLILFGILLSGLSACGGGGGSSSPKSTGTTPGTYTITVYGNGWVTGTVTLTVQ